MRQTHFVLFKCHGIGVACWCFLHLIQKVSLGFASQIFIITDVWDCYGAGGIGLLSWHLTTYVLGCSSQCSSSGLQPAMSFEVRINKYIDVQKLRCYHHSVWCCEEPEYACLSVFYRPHLTKWTCLSVFYRPHLTKWTCSSMFYRPHLTKYLLTPYSDEQSQSEYSVSSTTGNETSGADSTHALSGKTRYGNCCSTLTFTW